jgi:hypothetical protein
MPQKMSGREAIEKYRQVIFKRWPELEKILWGSIGFEEAELVSVRVEGIWNLNTSRWSYPKVILCDEDTSVGWHGVLIKMPYWLYQLNKWRFDDVRREEFTVTREQVRGIAQHAQSARFGSERS